MKVKILTFSLMLTSLLSLGQIEKNVKDRSRFGIKAGPNYSKVIYGGDEKMEPQLGFNAGCFYNLISGKKLMLPLELVYNKYASKSKYYDYSFSTINVNCMANYFASKHFYIEGGAVLGLYLNGSATNKTTKVKTNLLTDDMTPADVSLGIGFGYEFTNRVFLNLRTNYGLLPVFISDDNSSHLFNTTFNIGYTF